MELALIALAAFFVTEFVKSVAPVILPHWLKMVVVAVAAVGTAVLIGERPVVAAGATGLAAVVHKAHRWLSAHGDAQRAATMTLAMRRR